MIYEVTLILIIIVAININNDEIILIIVTDKLYITQVSIRYIILLGVASYQKDHTFYIS